MLGGKKAVLCALLFGLSAAVFGCMGLPPHLVSAGAQPLIDFRPAAPDLRIPGEPTTAASQTADIPVVPVPLPPLGREPAPRPAASGITPAATSAAPPSKAPADGSNQPAKEPNPPVVATTPAVLSSAAPPGNSVQRLQQLAAERYASMDSYIARLTRREQVNGKNGPEEIMLFKFRKEPWSIYFRWLGEAGKGREVVYVRGQHENKIHTLLAAGDMPLMPAGKRLALPIDSSLIRSACRHPITEAGFGASIERLGTLLSAMERGDKKAGTLTALGPQARAEFRRPAEVIEHLIPAGTEPELPRGGRRQYWFDPETNLPLLVIARDDRDQEVEYYRYDKLLFPVKLDADDFDPDKLWKKLK
jgi:hypothetical protein